MVVCSAVGCTDAALAAPTPPPTTSSPAVPSAAEVDAARSAVDATTRSVARVRTRLLLAGQRADAAAIRAAQATEAFNTARWRAAEARTEAAEAEATSVAAAADLAAQRDAYAGSLVTSYQNAGDLGTLSAMIGADGIGELQTSDATRVNAAQAMEGRWQRFNAASVVAEATSARAEAASTRALEAERAARESRSAAAAAADSVVAEEAAVGAERRALIARLAELEGISVDLAGRRQEALEAEAAQAAAQAAASAAEQTPAPAPAGPAAPAPARPAVPAPTRTPSPVPTRTPAPVPSPTEAPSTAPSVPAVPSAPAVPTPPTVPVPSGGAAAAVAFAQQQKGAPYKWGAAGPHSWDCSGLVMKAWAAGGTPLPHSSVGQYLASTPIQRSQLRAGDLVFWGSSAKPGSIFHVAIYQGDGTIIHAPRTGRPVSVDKLDYWIPPTHFARP